MMEMDVASNVGVVLPVIAGVLYCVRDWQAIKRVRIDGQKEDGCLDRVLLEHWEEKIAGMKHIGRLIAEGADSFMWAEYRYLVVFTASFVWVVLAFVGMFAALAFAIGCATSILAGYIGMKVATYSNSRTTHECWRSLAAGYNVAMLGGCIASFSLVCLGLTSHFLLILAFAAVGGWQGNEMWIQLCGFSLGVASIGLFGRVGGGIYTKAADIGADLSGKMDFGLMEDDYRNPACICDNVGDNVGGIVGIGADLFSSLTGALSAAFVLSGSSGEVRCGPSGEVLESLSDNWRAMMFPMVLASTSLVVAMSAMSMVRCFRPVKEAKDVENNLKNLLIINTIVETPLVYVLAHVCLPPVFALSCSETGIRPIHCVVSIWLGLWCGLVLANVTEYYTSHKRKPVREIAAAQEVSAASGVIFGLAVGYLSCTVPVFCLAITVLVAQHIAGSYGVALAAQGLLLVMPLGLAIDAYDSIADNAGGIAEMSGLSSHVHEIADALGGAGSIGNGFATGSAALVSFALLRTFWLHAEVGEPSAMDQCYFTGLFLGAMLPYAFSAITMKSVGKAATDMVEECRLQFPRIINSFQKPDYNRCIKISTEASLKEMFPAGLIVIGAPVVAGLFLGKKGTAGLLQGSIVSGVQMAISMINTGGAWDNAKKYVTDNGRKDSEQHKNAVIGDIVGDPLKDVSGPSLNVLMNLSAITSVAFGRVISDMSGPHGGPFWLNDG